MFVPCRGPSLDNRVKVQQYKFQYGSPLRPYTCLYNPNKYGEVSCPLLGVAFHRICISFLNTKKRSLQNWLSIYLFINDEIWYFLLTEIYHFLRFVRWSALIVLSWNTWYTELYGQRVYSLQHLSYSYWPSEKEGVEDSDYWKRG